MCIVILPTHTGSSSDQFPLGRHSLCIAPLSTNPVLQVWFTTAPAVVTVTEVLPFTGIPGFPQSAAQTR